MARTITRFNNLSRSNILAQDHMNNHVDIGEFTIRPGYGGDDKIWITRGEDGEGDGGDFDKKAFNDHVRKFFEENF